MGPYRLVRLVGRGGMGVVFEAQHERLGQRAAVKLIWRARRQDVSSSALRRFLVEARALARADHPGLVRVFDCGEDEALGPWISMEYLVGETLRARLDRLARAGRRLPLDEVLRTSRQIASAVAAIHRAGIVHRDLKPDNVMIVGDEEAPAGERIKLLDFGVAKLLDGEGATTEGVVLGTVGYMAPEQCMGESDIDAGADVYALGVIVYEVCAGERPFSGEKRAVMAQHVTAEAPALADRAPAALSALVAAMLAKEPTRRPASEAVLEALRAMESPGEPPGVTTQDGATGANAAGVTTESGTTGASAAGVATEDGATGAGATGGVTTAPLAASEPAPRTRPAPPAREARGRGRLVAAALAGLVAAGAVIGWRASRAPRAQHSIPGMARIAGAAFRMGSTAAEVDAACASLPGGCEPDERPQLQREQPAHEVTVSSFLLDVDEVTNREYAAFLEAIAPQLDVREDSDDHSLRFVVERASGLLMADLHPDVGGVERAADGRFAARSGRERRPMVQVTWDGASRYCRHLGKRLPTEAEWELAARGPERRRFPWGDAVPRCNDVVFGRGEARGCPSLDAVPDPVGAATQDVTPEGVRGLAGNVSEWVQDQFVLPYYGDCGACVDPSVEQAAPITEDIRIFRGGSFRGVAWFSRATTRSRWKRAEVMEGIGFRCASR